MCPKLCNRFMREFSEGIPFISQHRKELCARLDELWPRLLRGGRYGAMPGPGNETLPRALVLKYPISRSSLLWGRSSRADLSCVNENASLKQQRELHAATRCKYSPHLSSDQENGESSKKRIGFSAPMVSRMTGWLRIRIIGIRKITLQCI